MNERLQNILYRCEKELDGWHENIVYHRQQFIIPYNPYWEDVRKEPLDIEELLRRLLEIFVGYGGKSGGAWKWHESLDYGTGFSTGIICQQIQHVYLLGVDKEAIYLESTIAHPESIHKMFDQFVHSIADYSRFGVFSYSGSEIFDDSTLRSYRGLLKKKTKGQLSDLLRHYFIAKAEFDGNFDFGFLAIRWPLDKFSMYQILTQGCQAFEVFHHLNLELWKKSTSRKPKG